MKIGRIMVALPVAGMLLAGCGGSGNGTGTAAVQTGQTGQTVQTGQTGTGAGAGSGTGAGIAVGEPAPATLAILPFTRQARAAACAETRNRLFVIDGKQVFWDHAGNCADASNEQVLYAAKPDAVLCTHGDTIAGPRTACQDDSAKAAFETMIANLDKADLGLGSAHKVEQVPFLPQAGAPVAFESVASSITSGVTTRQNVVIRDQATWDKLWTEHSALQLPPQPAPQVDFSRKMLVGVFAGGYHDGCYGLGIAAVHAGDDKLVVEVNERGPRPGVMCAQIATNPMHVVAVDRIDADVDFVVAPTVDVAFETLATTNLSQATGEQDVVARDADAYARLWAQFNPGVPAPQVDFSKNMVIGVFMGTRGGGCYATGVGGIARTAGELRVQRVDQVPGAATLCTALVTSPAQLVVLERSDLPVSFATVVRKLGE